VTAIAVPLTSRRREWALLVQKAQHVLPSPVLLQDGLARLLAGASGFSLALAVAEIGASTLVIVSFLRAVRQRFARSAAHHDASVDWVDAFLGVMLLVEVVVHREETGHLQRPTLLLGVTMLALGLTHGWLIRRLARRRTLRVDDQGITAGLRFFRRFSAGWSDISEIAIGPAIASVITRDRRECTFDLRDLSTAPAVRDALVAARGHWERRLETPAR